MTVQEAIEILKRFPPDSEIVYWDANSSDWTDPRFERGLDPIVYIINGEVE